MNSKGKVLQLKDFDGQWYTTPVESTEDDFQDAHAEVSREIDLVKDRLASSDAFEMRELAAMLRRIRLAPINEPLPPLNKPPAKRSNGATKSGSKEK
ncbi:hypothetical protein GGI24_003877, partial [Coemansia furcata]